MEIVLDSESIEYSQWLACCVNWQQGNSESGVDISGYSTWRVEDCLDDAGFTPEGYSSIPSCWHSLALASI